jgi:uncharacterized protein DUF6166
VVRTYRGIREPLCHVRVIEDSGAAPLAPGLPAPPASTSHAISVWRGAEHELAVPRELVAQILVPFEWGSDGPGTHYLAVALLAELFGAAQRATIKVALPFMRRFLTQLPKDDFEISESIFRAFLFAVGVQVGATAPTAAPAPPAHPVPVAPKDGARR